MKTTSTIGLDLAKSVFQVHGVDADGAVTIRRQLKRKDVPAFFAKLAPCLIGMEACGTAHYWARELKKLGHRVKLIPAKDVKAYVRRGKTDAADAEAICEAVTRRRLGEVPVKSVEQQCALMVHRVRTTLIMQRTQTLNAIRSHLAELGLIAPVGNEGAKQLLALVVNADARLPALARTALAPMVATLAEIEAAIATCDQTIVAAHKSSAISRRLAEVPGVGVLTASAIAATVTDPKAFPSGRSFAASLGLTPRLTGTGGKVTLGPITKAGDGYLRRLLYLGAVAVTARARRDPAKADPWLTGLLGRLSFKAAATALANKTARIVWALLSRGEDYVARHQPAARIASA